MELPHTLTSSYACGGTGSDHSRMRRWCKANHSVHVRVHTSEPTTVGSVAQCTSCGGPPATVRSRRPHVHVCTRTGSGTHLGHDSDEEVKQDDDQNDGHGHRNDGPQPELRVQHVSGQLHAVLARGPRVTTINREPGHTYRAAQQHDLDSTTSQRTMDAENVSMMERVKVGTWSSSVPKDTSGLHDKTQR